MAGVNSTNSGLAFTNYMKQITETLNHQSKGRMLCKQKKNWTGSHLEWRVHVSRTNAVGFTDDGGQFPVPGKQGYVTAKAYRRAVHGKIQLTDLSMAAIKNDKNAAKGVVVSEMEGLMRDLLKFENWYFFRDGSGDVATLQATATAATCTVDDARGMWEGAQYDEYNGGTFVQTLPAVSKITSDPTASNYATVTLGSSVTTTDTHVIKWKDATTSNAVTGLKGLIDDTATGTFQNVTMSSYPKYASLVMGNSGTARALEPSLFRQMLAGIKQKCGNDTPAKGLTVLASVWDGINVEELYEGELRLSPTDKVGGLAVSSFQSALGRVDIVTDPDMLLGSMFFADFSKIYRGVQKPLEWRRSGNGSPIFLRSDTSGVYTATALEIYEHFITDRASSGRLDDLSYERSTVY